MDEETDGSKVLQEKKLVANHHCSHKKKWMLIFGWNVGAFFRKHIPDFSETAAPKKSMNHERARTKRRSGKKGVKMQ